MILIVDDNPVDRELLAMVAKRTCQASVLKAATIKDALILWKYHKHEIDMIFCDLELGKGERGDIFLDEVRADGFKGKSYLMSAYESLQTIKMLKLDLREVENFFPKPVAIKQLKEIFSQYSPFSCTPATLLVTK